MNSILQYVYFFCMTKCK